MSIQHTRKAGNHSRNNKQDHYINKIVSLYLNNQDKYAQELTELYLSNGNIQDERLLQERIQAGIDHLIKLERNYQDRYDNYIPGGY